MAKRKTDLFGAAFRAADKVEAVRQQIRAQRGKVGAAKSKSAQTRVRNKNAALADQLAKAQKNLQRAERKLPKQRAKSSSKARPGAGGGIGKGTARKSPGAAAGGSGGGGGGAVEWEIGLSYDGSRRQGNSVMVNFRIFKRDGSAVAPYEAREAVRLLHRGDGLAEVRALGLGISGVEWQGASRSNFKSGSPNDLESFSAIMQTVYLADFRVSPVKDDE